MIATVYKHSAFTPAEVATLCEFGAWLSRDRGLFNGAFRPRFCV